MPRCPRDFPVIDPGETKYLPISIEPEEGAAFSPLATGETIISVVFSISVVTGVDALPASHFIGSPIISGKIVMQLAGGFLRGVTYEIEAIVTTSGNQVLTPYTNLLCEDRAA